MGKARLFCKQDEVTSSTEVPKADYRRPTSMVFTHRDAHGGRSACAIPHQLPQGAVMEQQGELETGQIDEQPGEEADRVECRRDIPAGQMRGEDIVSGK